MPTKPLTHEELRRLEQMADALTPARDMLMRDQFATTALQAMLIRGYYHPPAAAELAYAYADAMLKAREGKP